MAAAPPIDRKTSQSIRDAVGERLQRDIRSDPLPDSSYLAHLLDSLRRQDRDHRLQ
jgi:hypothetical protein